MDEENNENSNDKKIREDLKTYEISEHLREQNIYILNHQQ